MEKIQTSLVCFCFSMSTCSAQAASNDSGGDSFIFWLVVIVLSIIAICWLVSSHRRKCASCTKWSAMKTTQKICTGSRAITMTRKVETKNRKGEVIATTEVPVSGTRYYYDVHRKCKYCGYKDVYQTSSDSEN